MTADKSCATCAHADSDMICVNLNSEQCGQVVFERDSCEYHKKGKGERMSCNYCDIQKGSTGDLLLESGFDCEVGVYLYRNTSGEYFITQNMGDVTSNTKISTCPVCAEPLTEPVPLTLEQLRQMCGEPIYKVDFVNPEYTKWVILEEYNIKYDLAIIGDETDYGKSWLAYDRPPKEQTP